MLVETINIYVDFSFVAHWTLTLALSIHLLRMSKR